MDGSICKKWEKAAAALSMESLKEKATHCNFSSVPYRRPETFNEGQI